MRSLVADMEELVQVTNDEMMAFFPLTTDARVIP